MVHQVVVRAHHLPAVCFCNTLARYVTLDDGAVASDAVIVQPGESTQHLHPLSRASLPNAFRRRQHIWQHEPRRPRLLVHWMLRRVSIRPEVTRNCDHDQVSHQAHFAALGIQHSRVLRLQKLRHIPHHAQRFHEAAADAGLHRCRSSLARQP